MIPRVLYIFLIFVVSCTNTPLKRKGKVLAVLYGEKLYLSDMDSATLNNLSGTDSVEFLVQQENAWVKERVLLHKAQNVLSEQEKSLDKKLIEYKNNLLVHALRERLLLEKLDTNVTEEELQNHYNENLLNFELKRSIAKILFVKVHEDNYDSKLKTWMQDTSLESRVLLKKYCKANAENYYLKDQKWLYFDAIWKEIPISKTYDRERFLKSNKFFTFKEDGLIYLLNILDFKVKSGISPYEIERDKIRQILLNKRRVQLLRKEENDLLNEAYEKGEVKIKRELK